ncbi:MAG: hypothetical protein N2Z60_05385 [Elusimicrobiales bacterium]|nr:hypothetical protein [Elusimicrobiales bacterium]HOL63521.1 hypothetical protein [Elusimicrobiales bacterium]
MIAEVLFPVALDKTFYYKVPEDLKSKIKKGLRIYSSFANREKVLGYVIDLKEEDGFENRFELKEIEEIIDENPIFIVEKFMELSEFMSQRWVSPLGMVLGEFLRFIPKKIESYKLFDNSDLKIWKNERKIIVSSDPNALVKKIKDLGNSCVVVFFPNILSLEIFSKKLESLKMPFLKYSSEEKISERKKISSLLLANKVGLVLTTKAGVFLPFPADSFFIVTDPLNPMYRQFDRHPYYSTVEVLEKISEIFSYSLCHFSASLSPNLLIKKEKGWDTETLNEPKTGFELRDIKKDGFDSDAFLKEIQNLLIQNKKILIMSYSKYMASMVYCPKCGWIKRCDKCRTAMKVEIFDFHKKYLCSYCGRKEEYSNICPQCKTVMSEKGSGTQKIYDILVSNFPDKKINEIDGRCLYSKKVFNQTIEVLSKEDYDVLISTDIIASTAIDIKFDNIYLAVYENHNDYDYSYSERFADKIAVLSSKLKEDGKLTIYAYNPESYVFSALKSKDYLTQEAALRKAFNYPPYAYLYKFEIIGKDKKILKEKIKDFIKSVEDKKNDLGVIDYIPGLKIKKIRGEEFYSHSSWVKLSNYKQFFDFLKKYCKENKFKFNAIEK